MNEDPLLTVIHKSAGIQKEKNKLSLIASNCSNGDEIEEVSLQYLSHKKMEIPEVRKVFVESVENILDLVNSDEKVDPYLKKGPVSLDQLNVSIGFADNNGELFEPPYIAYAYLYEQKIYYCYHDNLFGKFIIEEDIEESYYDALQLVQIKNK